MNNTLEHLGKVFLSGAILTAALAAQPDQEELKTLREEKLASAFLGQAKWTTDYDKARAQAKEAKKVILAYFTRSFAP